METNQISLSPKMEQANQFILQYIRENNVSPTYREIADHLGVKTRSRVAYLIDELMKRTNLRKKTGVKRALFYEG
jgi:SOS-response transcriptional repressor LexA